MPVPSGFLAQTGCVKGWNESAQQSNGVAAPGCEPSGFLSNNQTKERGVQQGTDALYPTEDECEPCRPACSACVI